ncbi:MAG: hypothetical protein B6U89_06455, partial [Desulfurococcales archaeon ex4484_58]
MEEIIIRSLTFFLDRKCSSIEYIEECYGKISRELNILKTTIERLGYKVFTTRIVLAENPLKDLKIMLDRINPNEHLVSLGVVKIWEISWEDVFEIVDNGFYIMVYGVFEKPLKYSSKISQIIHKITDNNPANGSRLAVSFHREYIETPYFPDTVSSGVSGIGISFLYPSLIKKYYIENNTFRGLTDYIKDHVYRIKRIVNEFYGENIRFFIDYSVSPWMENSVVDLIEALGYQLLKPGFNYGIYILNDLIRELVEKIGFANGFNEVMLPYAEDSKLIEAGGNKAIHAHHLLLYSMSCVAGPDMLVVPVSTEKLTRYILDTYSVWVNKKKPLALRIIPVTGNPG